MINTTLAVFPGFRNPFLTLLFSVRMRARARRSRPRKKTCSAAGSDLFVAVEPHVGTPSAYREVLGGISARVTQRSKANLIA